jgi:hypothetical protein
VTSAKRGARSAERRGDIPFGVFRSAFPAPRYALLQGRSQLLRQIEPLAWEQPLVGLVGKET